MHNGACEKLDCVVSDVNHRTVKGTLPDRLTDPEDRRRLVKFLQSIDGKTKAFRLP